MQPSPMPSSIEELSYQFNLAHRLQSDMRLKERLSSLQTRMADLEGLSASGEAYLRERNQIIMSIWKDCGYNYSMLTPFFFPDYPKGKPMSMLDRPFNMALMFSLPYWSFTLRGSRQIGKEQPMDSEVQTPTGPRCIGDLTVGDRVFAGDGSVCRVMGTYDQGVKDVYVLHFDDGSTVRCGIDHNWVVYCGGTTKRVMTLGQIIERYGLEPGRNGPTLPIAGHADFGEPTTSLPPAWAGYMTALRLMGDGKLPEKGLRLPSGKEDEMITHFCEVDRNKRVPSAFRFGTPEQRGGFLLGATTMPIALEEEHPTIITESRRFAEDAAFMADSLGLQNWTTTQGGLHKVRFKGTSRKGDTTKIQLVSECRQLVGIEPSGREESRCISVSSKDKTYLTDRFIVTHNTTTLGTRSRIETEIQHRLSCLYVAPHMEPLKTFARKYDEISKSFRFEVKDEHRYAQNLYFRKYPSGSQLELIRVQTSATPARGKTADSISFDEVQLFDPTLEVEVLETLNDSHIQTILYAGTSTTLDSLLEQRYQEGTQATWQILLDDGKTIDCGDPDQVIPCVGEYFMVDPNTGKQINPLRGFYRFNNPAAFAQRLFSVHIPQIINPDIAYDPIKWSNLYRTLQRDKTKFVQEKLGIPVETAAREISEADLRRICRPEVVGSPEERVRRAQRGYYTTIVSGVDWGGSDYNALTRTKISATTHAILGLTKTGELHILHLRKHGGMDYKTIINLIAKDHNMFRAGGIATDYGVGETYHELMRSHPFFNAGRHVIFHYTGPRTAICSVMEGSLANTLNLNRTESLTSLLLAITAPEPRLLAASWDEMGDLLSDFLNIHRVLQEKEAQGGQRHFRYMRVASKSDDSVHALNFAYSLVRLVYNQILLKDAAARMLLRQVALGGDRAPEGSYSAPSTMGRLVAESLQGWEASDSHYDDSYD